MYVEFNFADRLNIEVVGVDDGRFEASSDNIAQVILNWFVIFLIVCCVDCLVILIYGRDKIKEGREGF